MSLLSNPAPYIRSHDVSPKHALTRAEDEKCSLFFPLLSARNEFLSQNSHSTFAALRPRNGKRDSSRDIIFRSRRGKSPDAARSRCLHILSSFVLQRTVLAVNRCKLNIEFPIVTDLVRRQQAPILDCEYKVSTLLSSLNI